jgi:hypothetical protein
MLGRDGGSYNAPRRRPRRRLAARCTMPYLTDMSVLTERNTIGKGDPLARSAI